MVKEGRKAWKNLYFERLRESLQKYNKCFIVGVDNVRSNQMQKIRINLRGRAELLMGKNTMIRKCINGMLETHPQLEKMLPNIKENIGFVFTSDDLMSIRDEILKNVVAAPAKAGAIAPCDVKIPAQNTGLGPEKTSFFQALSIPTKITRGTIEILNEVHLIHKDAKVGASEATLLGMLKIYPFSYGLKLNMVYDDGTCYSPAILDITPEDIFAKFMEGVRNVAAVSLEIDHPTVASVPHSLVNGFKKLLAASVATDYTFSESELIKEMLANPSKFASAAPAATSSAPADEGKKKEPEPESDSDESMGMDLFG